MSEGEDRPAWIAIAALLIFISGFCSLTYQIVWERTLRFHFSGDSVCAAIISSVFLLGLGLGAWFAGRHHSRPLLLYGSLEIAVGLYAIGSYRFLTEFSGAIVRVAPASLDNLGGAYVQTILGSVLLLLLPCMAMGASLPLIFGGFIEGHRSRSWKVGFFYGVNVLGAAAACLVVPLWLLRHLDLPTSLKLAGLLNVFSGIAILAVGGLSRRVEPTVDRVHTPYVRVGGWRIDALCFLTGAVVLGMEVVVFRHFYTVLGASPFVFPFGLLLILTGIGVSGILLARPDLPGAILRRIRLYLVLAIVGIAAAVLLESANVHAGRLFAFGEPPLRLMFGPGQTLTGFLSDHGRLLLMAALMVAPVTLLVSPVFVLAVKYGSDNGTMLTRQVGRLYLINSCGAAVGAMSVQFIGFQAVGIRGVVTGAACLLALALALSQEGAKILAPVCLAVALLLLWATPGPWWSSMRGGWVEEGYASIEEGATGTSVIRWKPVGTGDVFVNGEYMSMLPDHPLHVLLEGVALASPRKRNVLVLGLGSGAMIRELLKDPAVESIEVVEWSRELPRLLSSPRAARHLEGALDDPRVRLRVCDARLAVSLYRPGSFDVIVDNLAYYEWAGSTNVRSIQYMQTVAPLLSAEGVYVMRETFDREMARARVMATLANVFDRIHELPNVLIGVNHRVALSGGYISNVHARQRDLFEEEFRRGQVHRPDEYFGLPVIRDEFPHLEYRQVH